jgi:hypothetical protein
MLIPTWRLILTGGAIVVLIAGGIGLVAAAGAPVAVAPSPVSATATANPAATAGAEWQKQRDRLERRGAFAGKLLRLGRHLVHVEATVTDRDGKLIVIWLDHGTVQAAGNGSVTISETGGGTQTVKTDDATIVRVGREDGTLADVTAGDDVFVQSRVDGGASLAKRILIVPTQGG